MKPKLWLNHTLKMPVAAILKNTEIVLYEKASIFPPTNLRKQ
jgi:hypothetical protein